MRFQKLSEMSLAAENENSSHQRGVRPAKINRCSQDGKKKKLSEAISSTGPSTDSKWGSSLIINIAWGENGRWSERKTVRWLISHQTDVTSTLLSLYVEALFPLSSTKTKWWEWDSGALSLSLCPSVWAPTKANSGKRKLVKEIRNGCREFRRCWQRACARLRREDNGIGGDHLHRCCDQRAHFRIWYRNFRFVSDCVLSGFSEAKLKVNHY